MHVVKSFREEGREAGLREGKGAGFMGAIQALNLLSKGESLESVSEKTGLSLKQLIQLRDSQKN